MATNNFAYPVPANSAAPRVLLLTSPVHFTKEFWSNSLDPVNPGAKCKGFRDLCSKSTPLLGTYFQVSLISLQCPVYSESDRPPFLSSLVRASSIWPGV